MQISCKMWMYFPECVFKNDTKMINIDAINLFQHFNIALIIVNCHSMLYVFCKLINPNEKSFTIVDEVRLFQLIPLAQTKG